jgi:hypothetical protein
MTYGTFEDWFNQNEHFALRSERFMEDVDAKSFPLMEGWLRIAWSLGAESADLTPTIRMLIDGYRNSALGAAHAPETRAALVAQLEWLLMAAQRPMPKLGKTP